MDIRAHWVNFAYTVGAVSLTILYFAKARDLAQTSEETIALPPHHHTLRDLLQHLEQLHPALRGATARMRVARNDTFAELGDAVTDNDVIALIPPVAGG